MILQILADYMLIMHRFGSLFKKLKFDGVFKARDDQYEWECRQRQLQREQRHRERMEEERLRPPSPPPVVHYTDHEAIAIAEKIKQDDTFTKAVLVKI